MCRTAFDALSLRVFGFHEGSAGAVARGAATDVHLVGRSQTMLRIGSGTGPAQSLGDAFGFAAQRLFRPARGEVAPLRLLQLRHGTRQRALELVAFGVRVGDAVPQLGHGLPALGDPVACNRELGQCRLVTGASTGRRQLGLGVAVRLRGGCKRRLRLLGFGAKRSVARLELRPAPTEAAGLVDDLHDRRAVAIELGAAAVDLGQRSGGLLGLRSGGCGRFGAPRRLLGLAHQLGQRLVGRIGEFAGDQLGDALDRGLESGRPRAGQPRRDLIAAEIEKPDQDLAPVLCVPGQKGGEAALGQQDRAGECVVIEADGAFDQLVDGLDAALVKGRHPSGAVPFFESCPLRTARVAEQPPDDQIAVATDGELQPDARERLAMADSSRFPCPPMRGTRP